MNLRWIEKSLGAIMFYGFTTSIVSSMHAGLAIQRREENGAPCSAVLQRLQPHAHQPEDCLVYAKTNGKWYPYRLATLASSDTYTIVQSGGRLYMLQSAPSTECADLVPITLMSIRVDNCSLQLGPGTGRHVTDGFCWNDGLCRFVDYRKHRSRIDQEGLTLAKSIEDILGLLPGCNTQQFLVSTVVRCGNDTIMLGKHCQHGAYVTLFIRQEGLFAFTKELPENPFGIPLDQSFSISTTTDSFLWTADIEPHGVAMSIHTVRHSADPTFPASFMEVRYLRGPHGPNEQKDILMAFANLPPLQSLPPSCPFGWLNKHVPTYWDLPIGTIFAVPEGLKIPAGEYSVASQGTYLGTPRDAHPEVYADGSIALSGDAFLIFPMHAQLKPPAPMPREWRIPCEDMSFTLPEGTTKLEERKIAFPSTISLDDSRISVLLGL